MSKAATIYICQQCGYQSPSYLGKCPNCESWGSLVETLVTEPKAGKGLSPARTKPVKLAEASLKPLKRLETGLEELDRVLGGGIVPGSLTLLAGDPGIGKSTLLLQLASEFTSLYVSGEESVEQVKIRFNRLKLKGKLISILPETNLESILASIQDEKYQVVIVDSIQTLLSSELNSTPGSIAQVRECAFKLQRLAKEQNVAVFLIGHVTKEGAVAGPKVLEHLVDTVLVLEGQRESAFRLLISSKNRFGPVDEIGVFEMEESGMKQVSNPSKLFLEGRVEAAGSVILPVVEGSRVLLTEVQALTNSTSFGLPIRRSFGLDQNRLQLLVATLNKRAGLNLQNQDVFINVVGGLKLVEPAADLAVCLAIAASVSDRVISKQTVSFGEVGLMGEIRTVPNLKKRVAEAKKLGFSKFITPETARTLKEAIDLAFEKKFFTK
ncbi:MAG: DNA repair protein RadA [bacterium]|nr:DNA repair protein RadA [bacterium]